MEHLELMEQVIQKCFIMNLFCFLIEKSFFTLHTGQVLFFTKQKGESVMDVNLILNGEQFASSYGYSMTALDCNGDG